LKSSPIRQPGATIWLAQHMRQRGIRFRQSSNAFLSCSDPEALQQLADSLTPDHLIACAQKWLARFTPFFTPEERSHAGVQHRLFFAQTEYCDNLVFRRWAVVDALEQRLLDANRTIGQPTKLTIYFRSQNHPLSSRQAPDRH